MRCLCLAVGASGARHRNSGGASARLRARDAARPGKRTQPARAGPRREKIMPLKNFALAILAVLVAVLSGLPGPAQAEELQERLALNGRVTLLAPGNFTPLPENLLKSKYPSEWRPSEVLSNESGSVNLAFNHASGEIPDDVDVLRQGLSEPFHKIYAQAEWLSDDVVEVNGRKFVHFEMITRSLDGDVHNILYMTPLDGRLLLISFNTTKEEAPQWLEIGRRILQSIKIQ